MFSVSRFDSLQTVDELINRWVFANVRVGVNCGLPVVPSRERSEKCPTSEVVEVTRSIDASRPVIPQADAIRKLL
jgi:hypothetical protein